MKSISHHSLITVVAILLVASAGCSSSKTVTTDDPSTGQRLSEINARAASKPARITLRDGTDLKVRALRIDPDSASWLDSETHDVVSVATHEITDVAFTDHGQGAVKGLLFGALSTGLVLGGLGLASGDDPPCSRGTWFCFRYTAEEKASMLGVAGAATGGLVGLITGALSGQRDTYHIEATIPTGSSERAFAESQCENRPPFRCATQ